MKIKVILIKENGPSVADVENDYKAIDEALEWDDAWNTPFVYIGGKQYVIVCSDLGKIKHWKVSAISMDNLLHPTKELREPFIVGNIMITKFDGTDDFKSLSQEDINLIMSHIFRPSGSVANSIASDWYSQFLVLD